MAFIDVITAVPGLTHYYPLDSVHTTEDAWGGSSAAPTTRDNFINFENQGGVTFATGGATFTGAASSWLRAPSHRDFSVRQGTNAITVFWAITVYDHDQGGKNYYMGKGCQAPGNYEWAVRKYGDPGDQGRHRLTSTYYWNPYPAPDGGLGSGSYIQPYEADSAFDSDNLPRRNAPVGFGDEGREVFIAFVFTYNGTGSPGDTKMYGGFAGQSIALINDRDLWADAHILPQYTVGDLSVGKRLDNDGGMFAMKMRRLAFFNRAVSPSELQAIGAAMSQSEGQIGDPGDPPPPGVPGVVDATAGTAVGSAGGVNTASITVNTPAIAATEVHCIAVMANAGSPCTLTTPTNYTVLQSFEAGNANSRLALYYRVGPASSGTAVITPGAAGRLAAVPFLLTGTDTLSPFEASDIATSLTAPTVTSVDSRFMVTVHGARESVGSAGFSFTPPSGMTELGEASSTLSNMATQAGVEVNTLAFGSSGATGTKTALCSVAVGNSGSISFLVKAAPGTGVKFSELSDAFGTGSLASAWSTNSTATTVVGGRARTTTATTTAAIEGLRTGYSYSLLSSSLHAQIFPPDATGATTNSYWRLILRQAAGADPSIRIQGDNKANTLSFTVRDSGGADSGAVTIAYDPAVHRWIRIRESQGTLIFETSPDGLAWVTRRSLTTPAWITAAANTRLDIGGIKDTGAASYIEVDNVNYAPVINAVKAETLVEDFAVFDTGKWNRSDPAVVSVNSNTLTILPNADTPNAGTVITRPLDLNASNVYARVIPAPGVSNSAQFLVKSIAVSTDDMGFRITTDSTGVRTLIMGRRDAASAPGMTAGSALSIPYDPVNHAFLRIRQDGTSNVYFETSPRKPTGPSDATWTVRHNIIPQGWLSNVRVFFTAAATTAGSSPARFSEINGTAGATPTPDAGGKLQTLIDGFDLQNASVWTWDGAVATGGVARVTPGVYPGSIHSIKSIDRFDAVNSYLDVLVTPPSGGSNPTVEISLESLTDGTSAMVQIQNGTAAYAGFRTANFFDSGSTSWTWVPGSRVRFREGTANANNLPTGTAGRFYIDTATFNAATQVWTWVNRRDLASPAWIGDVGVRFAAWNTGGVSGDALFDAVNGGSVATPPDPENPPTEPPDNNVGGNVIADAFHAGSLDTALWSSTGTPTVSSGTIILDADSTPDAISSIPRINLTSRKQNVEVLGTVSAAGSYGLFRLEQSANNALQFRFENGNISAQYIVNGTLTTVGTFSYNAIATRFVQIREQDGVVFFEFGQSPDSMTSVGQGIQKPFSVVNLKMILQAGVI